MMSANKNVLDGKWDAAWKKKLLKRTRWRGRMRWRKNHLEIHKGKLRLYFWAVRLRPNSTLFVEFSADGFRPAKGITC